MASSFFFFFFFNDTATTEIYTLSLHDALPISTIHTVYPTRRFEPLAFYDARDRVAVRVRVVARGVGSSVEVDAERGYVFDVRDGKIVRFAWFNEPLEALEA